VRQSEFRWKTLDGRAIHAVEWRPEGGAKGVVALVHGIGEHSGRYLHMAEAYCQAGYGMLAFDLPGHGRSEGKRGHASYALIMDQIDRLLDEARSRFPGAPVFLYGHSMGGAVSLVHILDRRPTLAGAVVTSPPLATATPVPAAKQLVARIMAKLAPSFTLPSELDVMAISRDPEVVKRYKEDPLVHDRVSARLGLDILEAGPKIQKRARELELPLLLLQGSADRIVDAGVNRAFAEAAGERITWKGYEGWFHELHNEPEKAEVFSYVQGWLAKRIP
jgi:alpha-beta hydrolase superfamily lysophospholipase